MNIPDGIDVSGWQPSNITAVVDYDFVFIKATQGTDFVSSTCDQQYQLAKSRGKKIGVYHFAGGGDAVAEAQHFYNSIKGYLGEAIPVLDFEATALSKGSAWVKTFVQKFKELTNVPPIIYGSKSPLSSLGVTSVASEENCALWVAAYPNDNVTGYYAAEMLLGGVVRQYTSHGRLTGYSGNLDLNRTILTSEQWDKYALGSRDASAGSETASPAVRKSNEEVANEVMSGAWGNNDERKSLLAAAGYDYATIQAIVNSKYTRKSNEQIANEIIAGDWGIGDDRKRRVTDQGYDYEAIRAIVNQKMAASLQASKQVFIIVPSGPSGYMSSLVAKYGTTIAQLLYWNRPTYPSMSAGYIQAGWKIRVK